MRTTTLLAATVAVALLAGCDEETINLYEPAESQIIATDADALAYPVTNNWNEPSLYSINAIKSRDVAYMQAFRCVDGAGLLAWSQGGYRTNKSFLFLAYYGPDGDMMPAVEILGDYQDRGYIGMNDLIVVWTPNGDAVIAFRAVQADDPESDQDSEHERVYYTWFRRALAGTPIGTNGEVYGFRQWADVVDTDTADDDRFPVRLFAATNLADGTLYFDTSSYEPSPLSEVCTGSRGDTCNGDPFLYLGWMWSGGDTGSRLAGGFVDLDTLQFSHADVSDIDMNPAPDSSDYVDYWTLATSGRDMAFCWIDYMDGGSRTQERLNLARVNDTGDGLDATVDVTRTSQTSDSSYIWDYRMIGDGYRVLNGSDATWFVFAQDGYTSDTVTNGDQDLVIAQVDDTGALEIGEFDHNPADPETTSSVYGFDVEIGRGATRAFVYYLQGIKTTDNGAIPDNDSLFARAIRLDADASLFDNVSNEARVNTTVDTTTPRSANVWEFYLREIDPFNSPDTNNDVSCVVFKQHIEPDVAGGRTDLFQVSYGRVAITDIDANPIAITSTESVIFPMLDIHIWANDPWRIPPVLVPAGTASGDCIVFLTANGNHADDNEDPDYFQEPRLFAYAPMLPDGQSLSGAVEIGSNNPAGPTVGFADYAVIDLSTTDSYDVRNVMALVTPNTPAARDCAFNDAVAYPDFAHVFFFEYLRDPDDGKETIWRSRALDLRADTFAAGVDRFAPVLGLPPARIGTGYNAALFEQMGGEWWDAPPQLADNGGGYGPYFDGAAQGNDLFVTFNEVWGARADPGFIFCNTFNPDTVRWANAALLSNDYPGPLASHGEPDMIFVPGVDAAGNDRIVGGWVFWLRCLFQPDTEENDVDLLQGRRLYATRME